LGVIVDDKEINSNLLKDQGNIFYKQGNYEEAVRCYHDALVLNPNSDSAWHNLGMVLKRQGKIEESEYCFKKANGLTKETSLKNQIPPEKKKPLQKKKIIKISIIIIPIVVVAIIAILLLFPPVSQSNPPLSSNLPPTSNSPISPTPPPATPVVNSNVQLNQPCPDGYFLGDDGNCWENGSVKCNCGGYAYCQPGGVCVNNEWVEKCPEGYLQGAEGGCYENSSVK
jgi:tetratricopeptide (TPR) repeat protein